ncbi:MAG: ABC transporter permease subunit [Oscillibacter sp.]|nr:ABC transporter permease subunit [Oscillibacter sp.]
MARRNPIRPWAVAVWLLVWQVASMALGQELLLPSPLAALRRLGELALTEPFWRAVGWSAARILGGFLLACLAGTALAALASRRRWMRELLAPLAAAVKATPVASFIILALVWMNSRQLPLFIAFLMVFPTIYLNMLEGIAQTDGKLLEMAQVFRVPLSRRLGGIYLPQVLPYFRSAASVALGLCWKAGVAAEVIGLPAGSIGERLYTAKVYFQTADLFAWTAVVVAVSAGFERLFLALLEHLAGKAGM